MHRILREERDIVISSRPLEATAFRVDNIRIAYVFYESGLSINVMYALDDPKKRAVGLKLSEGMEVPAELASRFKFALFDTNFFGGAVRQRLTRVGRRHGLHAHQEPVHVTERWLSHMMPITMKLTTLAANEDHRSQS